MDRRELAALLESIPKPDAPQPGLEQVRTPPLIATDMLWLAHEAGLLRGRVLDLGCGTGIFAWGAAALGAEVSGLDIDPHDLATAAALPIQASPPTWIEADVTSWTPEETWDFVIMNPPFGAQRGNRHADRAFNDAAARAVAKRGVVWVLAQTRTERFLTAMARSHGAEIERIERWRYPLEAFYGFHEHEARLLDVGCYAMTWPKVD